MPCTWHKEINNLKTFFPHSAQKADREHLCAQNTLGTTPVYKGKRDFTCFLNRTIARSLTLDVVQTDTSSKFFNNGCQCQNTHKTRQISAKFGYLCQIGTNEKPQHITSILHPYSVKTSPLLQLSLSASQERQMPVLLSDRSICPCSVCQVSLFSLAK